MKRFKITYIMNVDWDWAKQRPHFIAQYLSRSHDVDVLYPYAWRRHNLAQNDREGVKPRPFFRIPFGGRFPLIGRVNAGLSRLMARTFVFWRRPDFVWVSSPELFEYLPEKLPARLIYDCMDDVLAFPRNASRRERLGANERALVGRSWHVFCSSEDLRAKLQARGGQPEKMTVVHNAFEPSAFVQETTDGTADRRDDRCVLGYVGTISSWMDFDALLRIVEAFAEVEIHLLGPVENLDRPVPRHERIKFLGAVPHSEIQARVTGLDVLMMPFEVTDLIRSVDPVKLYEYVFFGKPIVAVRYPEIERFAEFADLYSGHGELLRIIGRYLEEGCATKYSADMRVRFIRENTWGARVACIESVLRNEG